MIVTVPNIGYAGVLHAGFRPGATVPVSVVAPSWASGEYDIPVYFYYGTTQSTRTAQVYYKPSSAETDQRTFLAIPQTTQTQSLESSD